MKTVIDGYYLSSSRGMGKFANQLKEVLGDNIIVACPNKLFGNSGIGLFLTKFCPHPIWEQFFLPIICVKVRADFLLSAYNTAPLLLPPRTKLVLVIHDLIFLETLPAPKSQTLKQALGRFYRKLMVFQNVEKAIKIVTVSKYSANLISQKFNLPPENISIIPNSLDDKWWNWTNKPKENFILTVTGSAPSKNLSRLIKVFARSKPLLPLDAALIVVGIPRSEQSRFKVICKEEGVLEDVIFKQDVEEQALIELYQASRLFAFLSVSEGFGIPVIEALATRSKIMLSSYSCLPEVAGNFANYTDPLNIDGSVKVLLETWHAKQPNPESLDSFTIQYRKSFTAHKIEKLFKELGIK